MEDSQEGVKSISSKQTSKPTRYQSVSVLALLIVKRID